eukprot:CAMPEP_0185845366 /NCGR_PEP_ID=MMETSP1354-20130828/1368_1 /TAXON_ID=708628 /ORGANISM="Erythrolobus madagascarensis, Strain CCMP3276" /LENGTH=339 /DNA_ID=CAMNT_0028545317 /DNA_START=150 /DNA_END=1169 /DNA_ORIENTATION=-
MEGSCSTAKGRYNVKRKRGVMEGGGNLAEGKKEDGDGVDQKRCVPLESGGVSSEMEIEEVVAMEAGKKGQNESKAMHQPVLLFPPDKRGRVSLLWEDVRRLDHCQYLNDSIIDVYLQYLLCNEIAPCRADECFFFSSLFYQKLVSLKGRKDFTEARRWTQSVELFEKRYLFFPICKEAHWFLVLVRNPGTWAEHAGKLVTPKYASKLSENDPCICVFDSMKSRHSDTVRILREFLISEWNHRHARESPLVSNSLSQSFGLYYCVQIPQQVNEYDCGLFLIRFVELFFAFEWKLFMDPAECKKLFSTASVTEYRVEIRDKLRALMSYQYDTANREPDAEA